MSDIEKEVARGIAREKTRESLAVIMVLLAIPFSWVVGSSTSPIVGLVIMLASFFGIWRYYRG